MDSHKKGGINPTGKEEKKINAKKGIFFYEIGDIEDLEKKKKEGRKEREEEIGSECFHWLVFMYIFNFHIKKREWKDFKLEKSCNIVNKLVCLTV